jgi:hypothetical protein
MATLSQLLANQQNAQLSTGPRTESGKAASSRNHLTLGLYTKTDYVKPEECELYTAFCDTMRAELNPETLLEETLVSEITAASWRLRRCDAADAGLIDFDDATDKLRRSVERARARSSSILHRGINQLRKLQTARPARALELASAQLGSNCSPLPTLLEPPAEFLADLDAILAEYAAKGDAASAPPPALGSNCKPERNAAPAASAEAPESGSNCKPAPELALDLLDKPDDEFREGLDALLAELEALGNAANRSDRPRPGLNKAA